MKNNKIVKYGLMVVIAFICFFNGNNVVNASVDQFAYCTYQIYEKESSPIVGEYEVSFEFNVVYTSRKDVRVYNSYLDLADKVAPLDNSTAASITVDSNAAKTFIDRNGKFYCPNSALSVSRESNSFTYTLTTSAEAANYNPDFVTVSTPKLIKDSSATGSEGIKVCEDDRVNEYLNKNRTAFATTVEKNFNEGYKILENWTNTFKNASYTTKEECDNYKNVLDREMLSRAFTNSFRPDSLRLINELGENCALSDEIKAKFQIYSSGRRKPISYTDKLYALVRSLESLHESNYRLCVDRAKDMNEEEKENEKDDYADECDDEQQETMDSIKKEVDDFIDAIDRITFGGNAELSCEGLLGDDLLDLISQLFLYVKIAAPIILLVMGSVDFGQAVISQDKEALNKAFSKFVKRAIICVAIFFLPIIIEYLLNHLDGMVKDPMCGIR